MAGNLRARDIMTGGVQCVGAHQSLKDAAQMMRDLKVGALPICGDNDQLTGMITDRDIVLKCCAEGIDPSTVQAGSMQSKIHWIDADADVQDVLKIMEQYRIKRLPVIDVKGGHQLVGIITEANLGKNLSDTQVAEFVNRVYAGA
ncbi:CBS domain-containing protein [Streptomyces sp. NPDC004561]